MDIIENFLSLLNKGQDSALLRYSLGNEYFKRGEQDAAVEHLTRAVQQDENYSAAWKMLGRALTEAGRHEEAADALERGITVAERKGDAQAAKEMQVFLKRSRRKLEET